MWASLLAIPIRPTARCDAADGGGGARICAGWNCAEGGSGRRARLLVFLLLAQWLVALKPEISADGLAMHLAAPMNIAANHYLTSSRGGCLWAVMPMGRDWAYAIVYLWAANTPRIF